MRRIQTPCSHDPARTIRHNRRDEVRAACGPASCGVSCRGVSGNALEADLWLDHVHKVYPDSAEHIIRWLAHRVQRPAEKINHALVLGGSQGIGKDTLLEPAKYAVGPWNVVRDLADRAARPLQRLSQVGDPARERGARPRRVQPLRPVRAPQGLHGGAAGRAARRREAPARIHHPELLRRGHHLEPPGRAVPAGRRSAPLRRLERAHQGRASSTATGAASGAGTTPAGSTTSPPIWASSTSRASTRRRRRRRPPAFWQIVSTGSAPEDAELADLLDKLGNPDAVTLAQLRGKADASFDDWLADRRNRRAIPHRMNSCGYVPVRNPEHRRRAVADQGACARPSTPGPHCPTKSAFGQPSNSRSRRPRQ